MPIPAVSSLGLCTCFLQAPALGAADKPIRGLQRGQTLGLLEEDRLGLGPKIPVSSGS